MTISEFSRRTIVDRHGVDPARVVASRQGIDRELFSATPDARDRDVVAGLGAPERYVIYPANRGRTRTTSACSRRWRAARTASWRSSSRARATVAGRGFSSERGSSASNRGSCISAMSKKERAAPAVSPGRRNGLPEPLRGPRIPPQEALSCGCPVAAARVAALPEALGDHAVWFDPCDVEAIAAALDALAGGRVAPAPLESFWSQLTWDRNAEVHRAAYGLAASVAAGEPGQAAHTLRSP